MSSLPSSSSQSTPPLQIKDLIRYFEKGNKPQAQFRIGLEHEKIGVVLQADGSLTPLPYVGPKGTPHLVGLFEQLIPLGYEPIWEKANLIGLRHQGASVTLEPGGQLEFSGSPQLTASQAVNELNQHLADLLPIAKKQNIFFLSCGFRPFSTLANVPKVPKERYQVMRQYLPSKGKLSLEMMHRTATVQANLDYENEQDAMQKFRVSISLAPFVTAMFAASPLTDGKPSGYQSYRAACWLETDNARCGIPAFAFSSDSLFEHYTKWALEIPMFFIYREHTYHPVENFTFRQFIEQGFQGQKATLADWELHLSTLFPDTRLRTYLEVRSADAGPLSLVHALPCFWQGLLYSPQACQAAWDFVKNWSYSDLIELRKQVPLSGMKTKFHGKEVAVFCQEIVQIAKQGLSDVKADTEITLLEPLVQIVNQNHSFSDQILAWLQSYQSPSSPGRNPSALLSHLALSI